MGLDPTPSDKTGETVQEDEALIGLRVLRKIKDTGLYLCEHYALAETAIVSGPFFMSEQQLDDLFDRLEP